MKYKMDDRFKTSDDIQSFEDFESMTLHNLDLKKKQENKKLSETKYDDRPPENNQKVEDIQIQDVPNIENKQMQNEGYTQNSQSKFSTNKPIIIELKSVGLAYGQEVILQNVDLKIGKGDFVYLVGESGAGKSSIIKMLYREIKSSKGEIIIDGQDVNKLKISKMPKLRRKIGVIFQDYKLLPDKTIFKNVAFSLEVTGYPKRKIKARVMEVLQKVGIANQALKYPNELSGGQQQRAAIARAIVDDPIILVADEPTGNLDPENALAIMEILEQINNEGTTIVMATHDVGIVNNFPKRVILLGQRKVLKESQGEYIYE